MLATATQTQPATGHARKSALDVEDDYSQYEVHSRSEIVAILRGMREEGSLITFHFNHGYDFLLTSLLEISDDGRTLLFDFGANQEMNHKALQTDRISCVSAKEKVRIQFKLFGVDPVKHEGRDAFLGDIPDSLVRLQRREFYRLATPIANPIKAGIPLPQSDGSVKTLQATVVDLSGGGIGLNLPSDSIALKIAAEFHGVAIQLGTVGTLSVDLRVRNLYDLSLPNGKIHQRAGCQFLNLPGPMMTLIQRYIIQVERERKALEL